MTSILTSLNRTIISGTILTLLFIAYYISADGTIDEYFWQFIFRYIHVLAGIMWIGLLYYFNFVQGGYFKKASPEALADAKAHLAPSALWWFRWGAMFTFFSGWGMVFIKLHQGVPLDSGYMTRILTGGLMGSLMWANVWFIIWPAQQKVIANAENVAGGGEPDPAAAAVSRLAVSGR